MFEGRRQAGICRWALSVGSGSKTHADIQEERHIEQQAQHRAGSRGGGEELWPSGWPRDGQEGWEEGNRSGGLFGFFVCVFKTCTRMSVLLVCCGVVCVTQARMNAQRAGVAPACGVMFGWA